MGGEGAGGFITIYLRLSIVLIGGKEASEVRREEKRKEEEEKPPVLAGCGSRLVLSLFSSSLFEPFSVWLGKACVILFSFLFFVVVQHEIWNFFTG